MQTVASIQARMNSTRLPGKVLLPLEGKPLVQRAAEGCHEATQVDTTVVTIGDTPQDEAIVGWAERAGQEYLVGPEANLLERHWRVAVETDADVLVRVTADSPLLPAAEVNRLVAEHRSGNFEYTTNFTGQMPVGMIVDIINVGVLADLRDRGKTHPAKHLREDSCDRRRNFSANPDWSEIAQVDLEVDTPSDYWTVVDAVGSVGVDPVDVGTWLLDHSRAGRQTAFEQDE
jgi:spore coat polysaccharide biosynthesis protein SpsF (cytidylyltransferase family)